MANTENYYAPDLDDADSIPRRLTKQAQLDRDEFNEAGFPNCSCHISAPCSSCTHTGNPINQEGDEFFEPDDEEIPPADAVLLASANRMLSGRLSRIAGALRSTGIISLNSIEDGEDLTPHVDWLISRHFDAIHGLGKQQALVEILKRNLDSKTHECEALRKSLEVANSRGDDRPIAGYTTGDLNEIFTNLDEAREYAEENVVSSEFSLAVYELRLIGTAKRSAEWVPA